MNVVALVGRLTKGPELRTSQGGFSVCTFSVAVQRRYKNQQTGQYDADFINCVAWRETAEFIHRHFIKGNRIGLTGSLQTRNYTAQDGSKRYVTEVVVENAEFVSPKSEGTAAAQAPVEAPQEYDDDDGDLPF